MEGKNMIPLTEYKAITIVEYTQLGLFIAGAICYALWLVTGTENKKLEYSGRVFVILSVMLLIYLKITSR